MQFVVLWSQKEKSLILKGAEKPRELIKIQRGEKDGDAQNVSVQLQRVLLLAVCTVEALIYYWLIPLWVAFALIGRQRPNSSLLLLGKCRVQWQGKVEPIFAAASRDVESLTAALVQQKVWSTCVISPLSWPAAPVTAAALTPSAVSSSFKNKSTLKSGIKKKTKRIKRHSSIF